jgi:ABC-type uncharacterized transport system permease subunit
VPDIVIHVIASALYAWLAWHFWRTRWRRPAPSLAAAGPAAAASGGADGLRAWERMAILVPTALHGLTLYLHVFQSAQLRFGFAHALSAMTFLAVALYWTESLFFRLDGMEPLVLPLAALAAPLPALFPGLASSNSYVDSAAFKLHLALAMIAYSLFVIALLHCLLMTFMERRLHDKNPSFVGSLPPLLTMEQLLFRTIGAAFVFLTLTLATGIAFSETLFGRAMRADHKTVFAVLSWLTFGLLLLGRWLYGWRGRTALRGTLLGFVFLVLAYVGSRFVLEVVLGRS